MVIGTPINVNQGWLGIKLGQVSVDGCSKTLTGDNFQGVSLKSIFLCLFLKRSCCKNEWHS